METKKKKKNSSKHHINTTQEHQILREKPSDIEGKTMGQLRKISARNRVTTIKFMLNLSLQ